MSSGVSGRYQSKLFNFVHQKSRRLTEQWENTLRHVQVATKWGIELILYPVYLLLQSAKPAPQKLSTQEPQSRLQLEPETPPTADTPIQQVLEAVKNLPSAESTSIASTQPPLLNPLKFFESLWRKFADRSLTINSSLPQTLSIPDKPVGNLNLSQTENSLKLNHLLVQGIASSLVNRHLVLVTADNVILDILTPQQQEQLKERIINEIANYWRAWQQFEYKQKTQVIPEINRLLAKLTGGNSVQINALPGKVEITTEIEPQDLFKFNQLLTGIDAFVAQLEANALVPIQQNSQEIIKIAQTQFSIFLYGKEELVARGEIVENNDDLSFEKQHLQELIAAAINYFFGVKNGKNIASTDADHKLPGKPLYKQLFDHNLRALPKSGQLENEAIISDPWLNWNDLFGDSPTPSQTTILPKETKPPALPSSSSVIDSLPKNFTKNHQQIVQPPQPGSGLVQQKKPKRDLTVKGKIAQKVTVVKATKSAISPSENESPKGEISQASPQSTEMEAQPDWIEVPAQHIGYEKHLLEQLLEWLDGAMLWLEEILVKIFKWLQQLWRGK